jgi:hypothetical protein
MAAAPQAMRAARSAEVFAVATHGAYEHVRRKST